MRLDDIGPSDNVRDLGRGGGGGGGSAGMLLGLLPMLLGRRMGCGGIALLLIVGAAYLFLSGGGGLLGPTSSVQPGQTAGQTPQQVCSIEARRTACAAHALAETTWAQIFQEQGRRYQSASLNFFQGGAQSGCGAAQSAMGPFYCPSDTGIYLDSTFFDELANRFGAAGDFAEAYVIAHEVGHHVQNLTGQMDQVRQLQARASRTEGNQLSVQLELQADCYAGVWAARNRERLEPGDIEEGMTAANAIGDDTLQRQSQGTVVPDSFTHGTSEQRMTWLRRGLESGGDPAVCNTFG
ncbi:KPN_02809 family neutral zinc metallopeptidase [Sphingomonas aestuarii]